MKYRANPLNSRELTVVSVKRYISDAKCIEIDGEIVVDDMSGARKCRYEPATSCKKASEEKCENGVTECSVQTYSPEQALQSMNVTQIGSQPRKEGLTNRARKMAN